MTTQDTTTTAPAPAVGDRVIVTGYKVRVLATVLSVEDDGFYVVHRDDMPGYIRTLVHGAQVGPTGSTGA